MTKRIKYVDEAIGPVRVVEDFLPPPSELVLKQDLEKVTIALSENSVDFFRREARRHGTQYQRMIRSLLDKYVQINAPPNHAMQRTRER
jgi:hypothetical protein